jgi:hypothetical protein
MDRVLKHLDELASSPPDKIIATLREAATLWAGTDEPKDDQTIVVARRI